MLSRLLDRAKSVIFCAKSVIFKSLIVPHPFEDEDDEDSQKKVCLGDLKCLFSVPFASLD